MSICNCRVLAGPAHNLGGTHPEPVAMAAPSSRGLLHDADERSLCKWLLRPLKMVENSPQECTRARGRACFEEAAWDGYTVLLMHQEPVTVPWAFRTSVPSIVASWAWSWILVCCASTQQALQLQLPAGMAPQIARFRRFRALGTDWKTVFTRHNWT